MLDILKQNCRHYSKEDPQLSSTEIKELLNQVSGWKIAKDSLHIYKEFKFKNYYQAIAFVNAVAWIAHQQDHHPEITISYNTCHIEFTTHSINGLSLNDFICAARVDQL